MYYKVKKDGMIIDALEILQCVRYFTKIGILRCEISDHPQGIISTDGEHLWHVEGWEEFPQESEWDDDTVILEEFDDPELYQEIRETIMAGQDYSDFVQPDPEEERTEEQILADPTPMERLEALENALAIMAIEGRTM